MNEKSMFDFLITQGPTIFFMSLVNYFQYKYFTKTIETKDIFFKETVASKDNIIDSLRKEISAMHKEQVEMTKQHLEAQNKSNDIMNSLKDVLYEIKEEKKNR
jgi:F0F1-type ATP synthase membrane subunit b/b'